MAIALGASVVLTACGGGPADEKQAFIDATVEATCLIFESDNLFDPALEEDTKEIYASYGFDADNDTAMEEITAKYENDEEVQAAILAAIEECGSDAFGAMEEAFEEIDGMEVDGDAMMEEESAE